jgi:predicted FMN-binding regulatory protein PaiB
VPNVACEGPRRYWCFTRKPTSARVPSRCGPFARPRRLARIIQTTTKVELGAAWTNESARLLLEHPLAWVVSGAPDNARATPLPLRPVFGADGAVARLIGHFARRNPQVEHLRRDPRALILFLGPNGYISPSWLSDRTQAPTWNYASAQFLVEIAFVEEDQATLALLSDLVGAMEADRPDAWRLEELGARYRLLAPRIIGFNARVLEARPGFKLGQDESDQTFAEILTALSGGAGLELADWMAQAVPRGPRATS